MSLAARLVLVLAMLPLLAAASPAAAAEPTPAQAADLKKMQGRWRVATFETGGGDYKDIAEASMVEVKESKFELSLEGQLEVTQEIAIDPAKSPKEIELSYDVDGKKKVSKGIYEFEGDSWKFCVNEEGDSRPKSFSVKESPQFLLMVLKTKPDAPAEKPEGGDKEKPDDGKPFEIVRFDAAGLAVPKGWRVQPTASRQMLAARIGDGIGVPAVDETGEPLRIGVTVERFRAGKDSLDFGIEQLVKAAKANRRLEIVGQESIEKLKLADATEAALVSMEFINEKSRRSLQLKLLVKDDKDKAWIVSGFLVGGKESKLPTAKSELAQWLRSIVLTFCLDAAKIDTAKWKPFEVAAPAK